MDTSGWKGDATTNTLSRVAGGHSGGWAAEISNTLAGGNCGLDDKPSWVSLTQAGPYTVSIWARSDTPGLTLKLRVREFVSGVQQGSVSPSMALTSSWQQVTAVYTPVAPGRRASTSRRSRPAHPSACASRPTTHPSPTEPRAAPPSVAGAASRTGQALTAAARDEGTWS